MVRNPLLEGKPMEHGYEVSVTSIPLPRPVGAVNQS